MMTISDLPTELVEEILYRVSLTSLNSVRLTCRTWNAFSKKYILGKKARKNQFPEFMIMNTRVSSMRLDLKGILNDDDLVMKQIINPKSQVEISKVFHCDGLLLCVTKDRSRLLVWNPYLGQIKWIQVPWKYDFYTQVDYALGYDNNSNHKIIRHLYDTYCNKSIEVYDFCSKSWRFLSYSDDIITFPGGVSLKGNAYFLGLEITRVQGGNEITNKEDYLCCFDFTTERFGSRLPLPFTTEFPSYDNLTLCWVRDEKLAVLYNQKDTCEIIEIWITTKIEPNAVSWIAFLKLDFRLINGLPDDFLSHVGARSFFIEEGKKVALLFDGHGYLTTEPSHDQLAYIVGEIGYFKSVNMGQALSSFKHGILWYSAYVPSLVQLKINHHGKRKERDE